MTEREVRDLLAACDAADDMDTGTLDAFREQATVWVVAELAQFWLSKRDTKPDLGGTAPGAAQCPAAIPTKKGEL